MTGNVLILHGDNTMDERATRIAATWQEWFYNKNGWMEEHNELRRYITATSTATTSNQALPWKNNTTTPKLTQIRDNLHSNYISSLFPNDDWLRWEAYSNNSATKEKKQVIESYMSNKTRREGFRSIVSQLLLDYIDFGNAFAVTDFVHRTKKDEDGSTSVLYSGPIIKRIHPYDIVMNPLAASFETSPVITRSTLSIGDLRLEAKNSTNGIEMNKAIDRAVALRGSIGGMSKGEARKYEGVQVDGFGSYLSYLDSGYVEMLTFMGDFWNADTDELETNRKIQIIDRSFVFLDTVIPDWIGRNVYHTSWRTRSDSLWGMGPLDNLVGMQYRIDHLENLKADAMDLHVFPPIIVRGNVDEFTYGPMEEIHVDENGSVEPMRPDASAIQVNFEIQSLMDKMELFAGAPKEAMGFRTPGEKTAFEVQQLASAGSRIFQEKITNFEMCLLEPVLNSMLEQGRRNLDSVDTIRSISSDTGAILFTQITKEDLAGDGLLRPIGARHFSEQSIMIQNLTGLLGGPLGEKLMPHMSGKALASLVEDSLGLERYDLFRPNVGVVEAVETQKLAAQGQQQLMNNATVPQG